MIVPAVIRHRCSLMLPYIEDLAARARDVVRHYCDTHGYAFVGRLKTAESIAEKVETGRFSGWSDLDDHYACAVVVPTLTQEPSTLEFLRERFEEVDCRERGSTLKDPNVFRFDATRFIGRLKNDAFPDANPSIFRYSFEIQIRTAFEHAWSVTTHALSYKGDHVDWRRLRLAAQLKASVEQLDNLVKGFEQIATTISEQSWPEINAKRDIEVFFRQYIDAGKIPSEIIPASWSRFCENLLALLKGTTSERVRDPRKIVDRALQVLSLELETVDEHTFPRSISLLQFVLGVLVQRAFIAKPLVNYIPLITPELKDLYPTVQILGNGFDWESD